MINLTDANYFEETSLLRAKQAWQQESQAEKSISEQYQLFLEQVKRELSDLYAEYGVEGLLDYSVLNRRLTPAQLSQYKMIIQDLINQNRGITDEGLLLELEKLASYNTLTILDSRMKIIDAYMVLLVAKTFETVTESFSQTYKNTYNHVLYDIHRKLGVVTPFERLTDSLVETRILSDWSGDNYLDAIKYSRHGFSRDLQKTIKTAIRRNEPYQKVVKRLSKLTASGKGYKAIRNILRQETTRIISESTLESYEQSGIQRYQYLATLDNRTTSVCRRMDLTVFSTEDYEIGVNVPPLHFNCRSTITAYFEEDDLSDLQRRARNSETGQNYLVPANLSYAEWDKKYNS